MHRQLGSIADQIYELKKNTQSLKADLHQVSLANSRLEKRVNHFDRGDDSALKVKHETLQCDQEKLQSLIV